MVTRHPKRANVLEIVMAAVAICTLLPRGTAAFLRVVKPVSPKTIRRQPSTPKDSSHPLTIYHRQFSRLRRLFVAGDDTKPSAQSTSEQNVPLYRSEGLFAVDKPLDWTSNDVVSYIRGMLERDARNRGAKPVKVGSRRNKSRIVKVGHGGTLDPLGTWWSGIILKFLFRICPRISASMALLKYLQSGCRCASCRYIVSGSALAACAKT